ncbi:hypothetical protein OBBRIDRAFT_798063 [Obba rivulosa]|uniref:Uncharacterized protein n=1 Tax=Obba rivulosa TaxID=1052685 RepID=A0A8E2DH60_9APHY|nr:hypothetical protein OBBRIDRAFT_798063 [Obba rivulosa]
MLRARTFVHKASGRRRICFEHFNAFRATFRRLLAFAVRKRLRQRAARRKRLRKRAKPTRHFPDARSKFQRYQRLPVYSPSARDRRQCERFCVLG